MVRAKILRTSGLTLIHPLFVISYFGFFLVKFYKDRTLGWNLINLLCISDFDIFMYVLNEFYCMEKGGWGEDGAGAWNEGVGGSVWIPAVSYVLGRCGGVNRCMATQLQMFSCKGLSWLQCLQSFWTLIHLMT